jgi:dolichol-phosphate mannosyltransferase
MKLLICIPTYNEKENIPKLLGRLLNVDAGIEVLVIDDNSPDGTGDLVQGFAERNPRIHLIRRAGKMGLGSAYRAAFRWGIQSQFDAMMEMDADLSHRPRYIPKFLEALRANDLVVGSRWVEGGRIANWPWPRVLLSRMASVYSKIILGVPICDLTAGYVCYKREVLEEIGLDSIRSDGYCFQIEMKYRAAQKGYKIKEIPITFTDRKSGDSKISRRIVWEALWMVWMLRFVRHSIGGI